jgi:pantetheine-phosphate adenylyltransferase
VKEYPGLRGVNAPGSYLQFESIPDERLPYLVVGGTFDKLHAGHMRLLGQAFRHSRRVGIGLAVDRLVHASPGKGKGVSPFMERKENLERWLEEWFPSQRWIIVPLKDREGTTLDPATPALAVSEETLPAALKANQWRIARGYPPLTVVVVGRYYGEDMLPVASRRIRRGEIDTDGNRMVPLTVEIESRTPKRASEAILGGFSELMPGLAMDGAARRSPDYRVRWIATGKVLGIDITDSAGDRLQASLTLKASTPVGSTPETYGVAGPIASHLLWSAFMPRWLSRAGFLPPSIVVSDPSVRWPQAGRWTRKVYSASGAFPYQ